VHLSRPAVGPGDRKLSFGRGGGGKKKAARSPGTQDICEASAERATSWRFVKHPCPSGFRTEGLCGRLSFFGVTVFIFFFVMARHGVGVCFCARLQGWVRGGEIPPLRGVGKKPVLDRFFAAAIFIIKFVHRGICRCAGGT